MDLTFLIGLKIRRRDPRLVEACKQIRAHAARFGRPQWAYFTYSPEIRVLSRQGDFSTAWRRLRQWERAATGQNLSIRAVAWTDEELNWFFYDHPQILYFLHKYEPARRMLEALLKKLIARHRTSMSFEVLPHVYNAIVRPHDLHEVTLFHIYRRLGKSLAEWPD